MNRSASSRAAAAGAPYEPADAGIPVCPGDARHRNPSPLTDRDLHGHHSPLPA